MKSSISSIWYNSALGFYRSNRLKESRKLLIDIHKIDPRFGKAIDLLCIIDHQLQNYDNALHWIELLLKSKPNNPDLINRKGMILMKKGAIKEALEITMKTLESFKNHSGLLFTALKLNLQAGNNDTARQILRRIPPDNELNKISTNYIKSFYKNRDHLNLLLQDAYKQHEWIKALRIYNQFLENNEPSADSFYNIGILQMKLGNNSEAIVSFGKCMEYNPVFYVSALLYQWYNKLMVCDWEGYNYASKRLETEVKKYLVAADADYDIPIYILSFFDVSENLFKEYGTKYYDKIIGKTDLEKLPLKWKNKRIRIGYFSSRFWTHPIGRVYKDIFKYHNRNKFEIFIYSTDHRSDTISKEIIDGTDHFRDLTHMDSASSYATIYKDQIDILVTVGGHGDDIKMDVIAMKPAPIIVNAHGYNESLGGKFADYSLVDKEVIDQANSRYYTEQFIFLSRCSIPSSTTPNPVLKSRSHFGLPEDMFIYVSAAHPRKITPEIFRIWEIILEKTPGSVLWIFDYGIKEVESNILKSLNNKKLRNRIFFSGLIPYEEHLGRYLLADLLLDTPLYNCHSVGIEALRCGLPFISIKGLRTNSRFGASMLKTAGLDELICSNHIDYIQKAVSIGSDPDSMNLLKNLLNEHNTLFDTEDYVNNLEECFLGIFN